MEEGKREVEKEVEREVEKEIEKEVEKEIEKEVEKEVEKAVEKELAKDRVSKANTSRREFLQVSAGVVLGAGALAGCADQFSSTTITEQQRANKRKERARVFLAKVDDYDSVLPAMQEAWKALSPAVKDKSVFLKVNLVSYREGLPLYTNAAVVEAAIQVLAEAGVAKIKVGDGPALSRETEELARLSGIAAVCHKHGIEFVDLNIDDLEKVDNPLNFTGVKEFLLPQSVTRAQLVISMPKLKTHHWALLTCAMKNMFGVIPGRKYGWPKNILHVRGINPSIVDIVSTVKPGFAIVDGIVAMEGDGPLNGTARQLHALVLGDDVTAVDTVCGMCMELPVQKIPYLKVAGHVLGHTDLAQIDVLGKSIDSMKQKFVLPPTYEADGTPINPAFLTKGAETGVT